MVESWPERSVGTLVTLGLIAFFATVAAVMGRPDTIEDVRTGQVVCCVILGPLWAAIVYLSLGWTTLHRKRAAVVAVVVWVCVAGVASWWQSEKMELRERIQKLHKK